MGSFQKRLISLIDAYDAGNQSKFTKRTGIPASSLNKCVKGKKAILDPKHLISIQKFVGVSMDWLLAGKGPQKTRVAPSKQALEQSLRELENLYGSEVSPKNEEPIIMEDDLRDHRILQRVIRDGDDAMQDQVYALLRRLEKELDRREREKETQPAHKKEGGRG